MLFNKINGHSVVVDLENNIVTIDENPVNDEAIKDVIMALVQETTKIIRGYNDLDIS